MAEMLSSQTEGRLETIVGFLHEGGRESPDSRHNVVFVHGVKVSANNRRISAESGCSAIRGSDVNHELRWVMPQALQILRYHGHNCLGKQRVSSVRLHYQRRSHLRATAVSEWIIQ